jgi:hypothetical protein
VRHVSRDKNRRPINLGRSECGCSCATADADENYKRKKERRTTAAPPSPGKGQYRTALAGTPFRERGPSAASILQGPRGPGCRYWRKQKLDARASFRLFLAAVIGPTGSFVYLVIVAVVTPKCKRHDTKNCAIVNHLGDNSISEEGDGGYRPRRGGADVPVCQICRIVFGRQECLPHRRHVPVL